MSRSKRVNVSLPGHLYDMCVEIAALSGDSVSGVVARMVHGSAPSVLKWSVETAALRGSATVRKALAGERAQVRGSRAGVR